ncbi:hypothetical protein RI054_15g72260 [Pseudoscourfieldia marina]
MAPVDDCITLSDKIRELQVQLSSRAAAAKLLRVERDRALASLSTLQKKLVLLETNKASTAGGTPAIRALKESVKQQKASQGKLERMAKSAVAEKEQAVSKMAEAERKLNETSAIVNRANEERVAAANERRKLEEMVAEQDAHLSDAKKKKTDAEANLDNVSKMLGKAKTKLASLATQTSGTPQGWTHEALLGPLADVDAADAPIGVEGDRQLDLNGLNAVELHVGTVHKQVGSMRYPVADALTFAVVTSLNSNAEAVGTSGVSRLASDGKIMHRTVVAPENAAELYERLSSDDDKSAIQCVFFAASVSSTSEDVSSTSSQLPAPLSHTITMDGNRAAGFVGCSHASGANAVAIFAAAPGDENGGDDDESGDVPHVATMLSYDPGSAGAARLQEMATNGAFGASARPFAVFPETINAKVLHAAKRSGVFEESNITLPHPDPDAAEAGVSLVVWTIKDATKCPTATPLGSMSMPCASALKSSELSSHNLEASVRGTSFVADLACRLRRPVGALVAVSAAERARGAKASEQFRADLDALKQKLAEVEAARDAAISAAQVEATSKSDLESRFSDLEKKEAEARAKLEEERVAHAGASKLAENLRETEHELATEMADNIVNGIVQRAVQSVTIEDTPPTLAATPVSENVYGDVAPPAPAQQGERERTLVTTAEMGIQTDEVGASTPIATDALQGEMSVAAQGPDNDDTSSNAIKLTPEELSALKADVEKEAFSRGRREALDEAAVQVDDDASSNVIKLTPEELSALKADVEKEAFSRGRHEALDESAAREAAVASAAAAEALEKAAAENAARDAKVSAAAAAATSKRKTKSKFAASPMANRNFCALLKSTLKYQSSRAEAVFGEYATGGSRGVEIRPLSKSAGFAADVLPDLTDAEAHLYVALLSLGPTDGVTMAELKSGTKEGKLALDAAAGSEISSSPEFTSLHRALMSAHGRMELMRGGKRGSSLVSLAEFAKALRRLFPSLPTLGSRTQLAIAYRAHATMLGEPHDGMLDVDAIVENVAALAKPIRADDSLAAASSSASEPPAPTNFVMSTPADVLDEISSVSTDGDVGAAAHSLKPRSRLRNGGGLEGFLHGGGTDAGRERQTTTRTRRRPPVVATLGDDETTSDESESVPVASTTRRRRPLR